MDTQWSLVELYKAFESEEFKSDMEKYIKEIEGFREWTAANLNDTTDAQRKIEDYIKKLNNFYSLFSRLSEFAELTLSTDAKNEKAMQALEKIETKVTEMTQPQVTFQKWIAALTDFEKIIQESPILREHEFYLKEINEKSRYMLSEEEEILISKLKNTGSNAWTKLQNLITSSLMVDIEIDGENKKLPLAAVRNMAYENDEKLRKTAYEAELKAYEKIEDSSAACLNGIKGEVITISKMRGYKSPLEKTLLDARMNQETLDAMLAAIRESLPSFQKYFRRKGELLGYQNGLPFHALFAPMGNVNMTYTYDEAAEFIVKNFRSFSNELANFADNAFKNRWIDAMPKEGKRGGAFCSNLHSIKESRVLTNFSGSFSDVITLAHELGHAYHGNCLINETYLNSDYPMPIAETASIFCETIIKNAALKEANAEETFAILETSISDAAQVIVDIYSRFLFESEVFLRREESSLSVNELKEIMIKAQKEAYGDGLDNNVLHPYMWTCKPHYYYAEHNFYNFPYAFGQLFALGLYSEYLKSGETFVKEYNKLLSVTGKNNVVDVARIMDIDVQSIEYWRGSLKLIQKDIEKFVTLK